jgi:hypothetical protein
MRAKPLLPLLTAVLLAGTAPAALAQATVQIVNINAADVGFNDATPVAPQPGNAATTLGQQRLNVFQRAAEIWGAALTSSVPIRVDAQFVAQTCTPTSGTLGSAGTLTVWRDFPNAPRAATWYPAALANKLAGTDLDPTSSDIRANFNSNVGQPGCLDSSGTPANFYLGLDDNPPAGSIYLLPVVLHELAHGLGFQSFTSGSTGERIGEGTQRFASVWEQYMLDLGTNKLWLDMTDAERQASAIQPRSLAWIGAAVRAAALGADAATTGRPAADGRLSRLRADGVLDRGRTQLLVRGGALNTEMTAGTAQFGPLPPVAALNRPLTAVTDSTGSPLACNSIATSLTDQVALVDRGTCTSATKVRNAQSAGAVAVVIVDNQATVPPADPGGTDPLVTIPAVMVSQADGARLRSALGGGTVGVSLSRNLLQLAGGDASGRVLLYTPAPFQSGSSVSHFDVSALPNLLMEPSITASLRRAIGAPGDLTLQLLRDLGW